MGSKTHEKQRVDIVALKRPEIHKVEDVDCTCLVHSQTPRDYGRGHRGVRRGQTLPKTASRFRVVAMPVMVTPREILGGSVFRHSGWAVQSRWFWRPRVIIHPLGKTFSSTSSLSCLRKCSH